MWGDTIYTLKWYLSILSHPSSTSMLYSLLFFSPSPLFLLYFLLFPPIAYLSFSKNYIRIIDKLTFFLITHFPYEKYTRTGQKWREFSKKFMKSTSTSRLDGLGCLVQVIKWFKNKYDKKK
jgi:hypothetical protein